MFCKICQKESKYKFKTQVLNKYEVKYFQCQNCDFIQTENPYWLDESYKKPINNSDTGILLRNIYFSRFSSVLIFFCFNKFGKFLDFAGGYGLFTRLMRDAGFDFFWNDPMTDNIFSKGFEWNKDSEKVELLTTFESFEHFMDPVAELEKMMKISDNILFSTELIPDKNIEGWYYLGQSHGQHISFYSKRTLENLAKKYNLHLKTNYTNIHLFTKKNKKINIKLIQFLTKLRFDLFFKLNSKTFIDSNVLKEKDY